MNTLATTLLSLWNIFAILFCIAVVIGIPLLIFLMYRAMKGIDVKLGQQNELLAKIHEDWMSKSAD